MQRDLGKISFLERLQDGLQFGAGLLEAGQQGCGTTVQKFCTAACRASRNSAGNWHPRQILAHRCGQR